MNGVSKLNVELNRKMLSQLAIFEPAAFNSIADKVKALKA